MADFVTTLGWSWDQAENELDLPRIDAFRRAWERVPPASVQLVRIAAALGLKPQAVSKAIAGPKAEQAPNPDLDQWIAGVPTVRRTKILTPEEFLGGKS